MLAFLFLIGVAYAQKLVPGDHIRLICEQEPTLSVDRLISPSGIVDLPILGPVSLAGKFIAEAEKELESLAQAKLGTDRILIGIALIADGSDPVEYSGAVNNFGSVSFHHGMTLNDIVKLAVPTAAAATERVEIAGADGRKMTVDLTRKGGGDIELRPGDRIFFPEAQVSNSVFVLGGVAHPGSNTFTAGLTVRQAIDLAGGISGHGERTEIRLERAHQPPKTLSYDSPDANLELERGDVVFVPTIENGHFVEVSGFVAHPGLVDFAPGMTLSQAIQAAGGLKPQAGADSITVKRLGDWKRSFDLTKILKKQDPDLPLAPDDIIDVPLLKVHRIEAPKPPQREVRSHPVIPP